MTRQLILILSVAAVVFVTCTRTDGDTSGGMEDEDGSFTVHDFSNTDVWTPVNAADPAQDDLVWDPVNAADPTQDALYIQRMRERLRKARMNDEALAVALKAREIAKQVGRRMDDLRREWTRAPEVLRRQLAAGDEALKDAIVNVMAAHDAMANAHGTRMQKVDRDSHHPETEAEKAVRNEIAYQELQSSKRVLQELEDDNFLTTEQVRYHRAIAYDRWLRKVFGPTVQDVATNLALLEGTSAAGTATRPTESKKNVSDKDSSTAGK